MKLGDISLVSERFISLAGTLLCYSIVVFLAGLESGGAKPKRYRYLAYISSFLAITSLYPGLDIDNPPPIYVSGIKISDILTTIYFSYIIHCTYIVFSNYRNSEDKSSIYIAITRSLLLFVLCTIFFDSLPYAFFNYMGLLFLGPLSGLVFSGTLYWACAKKNFFRLRESLNLLSLIILTLLVSTGFVIPLGQQPLVRVIIISICVGLVIDVWRKDTRLKTDYRLAKKQIKRLTAEQQGASSYIMDIAHRLKSPLAAIQHLLLGLHTRPASDQPKLDRGRSILADTARAMRNLLLSGKIDHQDAAISRAPFDLAAALREWREEWQALCSSNPVSLNVERPEITIDGDRNALKDALTNLVDNARKHSPTGAAIDIALTSQSDYVLISVTDRGPGLPVSVQPLIFQRHYQHKTGPDRESSSSAGLGLHLAKWVAEQHGGDISVSSRPNRGATFTISLPMARLIAQADEGDDENGRSGWKRWPNRRVRIKTLRPQ